MTAQKRPMRRRVQARVMKVMNVPMRWVLALPFTTPVSGRLMLLNYRGRRSGKQYRQPLSYVRHDDTPLTRAGATGPSAWCPAGPSGSVLVAATSCCPLSSPALWTMFSASS
jgi:hypothetical protein